MTENSAAAVEAVARMAQTLEELEQLRTDFINVLDLLVSGHADEVIPVGETGWPHWP